MRTTSPLHAVTWSVWAVAAALSVQLAPSRMALPVLGGISGRTSTTSNTS